MDKEYLSGYSAGYNDYGSVRQGRFYYGAITWKGKIEKFYLMRQVNRPPIKVDEEEETYARGYVEGWSKAESEKNHNPSLKTFRAYTEMGSVVIPEVVWDELPPKCKRIPLRGYKHVFGVQDETGNLIGWTIVE